MKKILCFTLIVFNILFLVSCSADDKTNLDNKTLNFEFIDYMGNSLDEVCGSLDLSKDELEIGKSQGRYDITQSIIYEDREFSAYLMFGEFSNYDEALYGGGYEYVVSDNGKALTNIVTDIKSMLTEKYGEPTTYPGLSNIIGDITDFSQYSNYDNLTERWTVKEKNPGTISLNLFFLEKEVLVQIEYVMDVR